MSSDKLRHDATASTKGTIYQLCIAVQKCYEMVAGQKVLLESMGDVTIPGSLQLEAKSYSDALTDNHNNLWNTLHNWMQDGFDSTPYTALILYTTQQFGEQSTISGWNNSTSSQRLEILEAINRRAEERESKRQKKEGSTKLKTPNVLIHQRYVLDSSRRPKLLPVIDKFVIEACSPELPKLHTFIKQRYIKGSLEGKKDDFLNALIGFIAQPTATKEQRWEITYESFERKVGDLNTLYCRETKVFPKKHFDSAKLPDAKQLDEHSKHPFVQKILDIEYYSVIPKAVMDYLGAVKTVSDEFKNYEVPKSRTEKYADEVVEIFETHYRTASRNYKDIVMDSQDFYDNITVEEPREFEGFSKPPMAFRNGLLHTKLDDDDKDLQWRLNKK